VLNLNGAAIYQGGDALPTGNSPRTLEFWVRQGNYMGTNVSYGDFGATLYVSGGSEVDVGTLRAPTGFPFGAAAAGTRSRSPGTARPRSSTWTACRRAAAP